MQDINFIDLIPLTEWAAIQNGTSWFDCSPYMNQALLTYGLPPGSTDPYSASGPAIIMEAGCRFYFADNWQIKRRVQITGSDSSGGNGSENSWCVFAPGKGVIIHSLNTIDDTVQSPSGYQGVGTWLRGLTFTPAGQSSLRPAIWLRGRATLEQLRINFFGSHGVYANASVGSGGSTEGSASQSHLLFVDVTSCAGDGFHFEGSDANAIQVIGGSAISCAGIGYNDLSGIGTNTYTGCHAAANGQDYQSLYGKNEYHDCYQEQGGPGSLIQHPAQVSGGNIILDPNATATATYATGASAGARGALGVRNGIAVTDPTSGRAFYLGTNWANSDLWSYVNPSTFPLLQRLREVAGDLLCDYADLDTALAYRITGPNTAMTFGRAAPVPYACQVERLFIGQGNNARQLTFAAAKPPNTQGANGDVTHDSTGASRGWRKQSGVWVAF
jgi:hypothetical protein